MSTYTVKEIGTLINFISARLPDMKKSTIKDRLRAGSVLVNGRAETKATYLLSIDDTVELTSEKRLSKELHGVEILHVDKDIVVINKPSGLLTIAAGKSGVTTVLNVVGPTLAGNPRLYPCHRLDQGTSGVLLLPRRKEVQEFYFRVWKETRKTYVAIVKGIMKTDFGTIDAKLIEDPETFDVSVSEEEGAQIAITHYKVLKRFNKMTLVEVQIETGRKHQIRVHMQYLGHPIVGDERYNNKKLQKRLCLHATELLCPQFGTGNRLQFSAPIPSLFKQLMEL